MKPADVLTSLPFVSWDRGSVGEDVVTLFGWIDRDDDKRRDFVYLEFSRKDKEVAWWATSSAKYSREISATFGGTHTDCLSWQEALKALEATPT